MTAGATAGGVYLVDAHAMIFQMFHGIGAMTAPDGRPTNALFGFTRALLTLRQERRPEYLLCVFDLAAPTFRDRLFADYKAHRPPPPDDLRVQEPMIHQVLAAMNVPVLAQAGFEADDVIATVAVAAARRGHEVFVCTSDKDCRQLIDDRIRLLNLKKNVLLDRAGLMADWGVTPEQVADYQALVGDSVDNVPGVPGVGAKTAAKLLQQFGSIDAMLARIDEVKPAKIQASLRSAAEKATLTLGRQLVCLNRAVPMELDWEGWKLDDWNADALLTLFRQFGFRSFAEKVRASQVAARRPVAVTAGRSDADEGGANLFDGEETFPFGANARPPADGSAPPPVLTWEADYRLIDTPEEFATFLAELREQKRFAVDVETTGLDALRADLVGLSFCWRDGSACYLPVRVPEGAARLDLAATLAGLGPILENPAVRKTNQNMKFDQMVLRRQGVRLAGVDGDPMVAHYLLHAGDRSHGLDELARSYLQHENIAITELIGKKQRGKEQLTLDRVDPARVRDYAAEDADVAWRLTGLLETELDRSPPLRQLYDELEVPLIDVLADLEYTGIRLDVGFLRQLSATMARQLQEIEREIHALAGHPFNIASLKQLRQVLFDELKLPVQRRTDLTNEPSTDQETLEKLAALGHALPRKIIEHRQISKLKGTYVDALPDLVNPVTGRVHTSFNQTVTSTGRLSSSDPNLQNVPTRTEQGREIRQAFRPREGWQLLTADYSQVELRLLAHFCGDEALRRAFAEGRDIHASVAAEIFKVPESEVTSAQRRAAKTVNFGVIYGISPHGLAIRLGISRDEAARFIDAYFARYPKVEEYQANLLRQCAKRGYVSTLLGRRRAFDRASIRPSSSYQNRNQAEREAINMEIQGSAADLMKRAMLAIHRRLRAEDRRARMLLTVHDELIFEVPAEELQPIARLAREEMTTALPLEVPLQVDLAAGPNWLEVAELPEAG